MSEFRDTRVAEEGEIVSTEAPDQQPENIGQSIADAIRRKKGFGQAAAKEPTPPQEAARGAAPATVAVSNSRYKLHSVYKKKLYEKPTPLLQQPKKKETLAQLFAAIVKKKLGKGIL